MNTSLFTLMQIADSALPVGGFAYSSGLEWMVKTGILSAYDQFTSYLEGIIRQYMSFEFPFINSFSALHDGERDSVTALEVYDTTILVPEMYKASVTQGKSWLRIVPEIFPIENSAKIVTELSETIKKYNLKPHFLFVFSRSLTALGFPSQWIKLLYTYTAIRDQMSAAIRLGSLGPNQAQQIQAQTLDFAEKHINASADSDSTDYKMAYKTSILPDLAQGGHSGLYSKLFQT